jgi:hypothetical protein
MSMNKEKSGANRLIQNRFLCRGDGFLLGQISAAVSTQKTITAYMSHIHIVWFL